MEIEKSKEEVKIFATETQTFQKEKPKSILKFIILLIPLFIIAYLFYSNFLVSQRFNYFYNIGSIKESETENVVLSPVSRISEPKNNSVVFYREIMQNLVYFNIPIPRFSRSINISIRFKDTFPQGSIFRLGAKDKEEWHYLYKPLFSKELENISSEYQSDYTNNIRLYKLNRKKENISLADFLYSPPANSVIAINTNFFKPKSNVLKDYVPSSFTLNKTVRGTHNFYIYIKDFLVLEIKKQDLNWYEGKDELIVMLYDLDNILIANTTIPDDNLSSINKNISEIQTGIIVTDTLPEGTYRLELSDFDGLVREITLNQNKIVIDSFVYLADNELFSNLKTIPTTLYFNTSRNSQISFKTWHDIALQNITIDSHLVSITQRANNTYYNSTKGFHSITSKLNDIIIEGPVYFSFTRDSYFEPFSYTLIQSTSNADWLKNNIDFLITDFQPAIKDKDWLISSTNFNLKSLYIKDSKLSMVFNLPHLMQNETNSLTIPVDWINISVNKPSLLNIL